MHDLQLGMHGAVARAEPILIKKGAEWRPTGRAATRPAELPPQRRMHRVPPTEENSRGNPSAFTGHEGSSPGRGKGARSASSYPPTRQVTPADERRMNEEA